MKRWMYDDDYIIEKKDNDRLRERLKIFSKLCIPLNVVERNTR